MSEASSPESELNAALRAFAESEMGKLAVELRRKRQLLALALEDVAEAQRGLATASDDVADLRSDIQRLKMRLREASSSWIDNIGEETNSGKE